MLQILVPSALRLQQQFHHFAHGALAAPAGPGEPWNATLAVTEQQALSLIAAQSAGREIRLLPRP